MFHIQLKCLRLIGLKRETDYKFTALQLSCVSALLFLIISQILFILNHLNDVLTVAEASATVFSALLSLSKFLTFSLRKEKIFQLIDRINGKSFHVIDGESLKKMKGLEWVATSAYLSLSVFCGFSSCIAPIVISSKDFLLHGIKFQPDLPHKTDFLYDISALPAYILSYAGLCLATYTAVFITVSRYVFLRKSIDFF